MPPRERRFRDDCTDGCFDCRRVSLHCSLVRSRVIVVSGVFPRTRYSTDAACITPFGNARLCTTLRATRPCCTIHCNVTPPSPGNLHRCLQPHFFLPDVGFLNALLGRPLSPGLWKTRSTPVRCGRRAFRDSRNPRHLPESRIDHPDASTCPPRQ